MRKANKEMYQQTLESKKLMWSIIKDRSKFITFGDVWKHVFSIDFNREIPAMSLSPGF